MLPSTVLAGLVEVDDMLTNEPHGIVGWIELLLGCRFWWIYTKFWEGEGKGLGSRFPKPCISQTALFDGGSVLPMNCLIEIY